MGRKKSSSEKKQKKTPVKLSPIPRKHSGKITEPWVILDRLVGEMSKANEPRFGHLSKCRLKLWWTRDWKADPDGVVVGAQVCKAGELDRLLVEENNGESPDVFIKLPRDQWPHLDDMEKEHRLFHELCHIRPALDANGKQKCDSKDRLLWRLGRHPIACFPEEIERFGVERVIGHNAAIQSATEVAARPLLKQFDEAEEKACKTAKNSWTGWSLSKLELPQNIEDFIVGAGIRTLGDFVDHQKHHGDFWDKDIQGPKGLRKPPKFRERIENAFQEFWAEHPECK